MARKKLGEMLIEAGVLDEHGLRSALADQRRWGRSLGRTLVEMKLVDEDVMVGVLGRQLGIESVDLDGVEVDPEVLQLVPEELARHTRVMPFRVAMKFLDVAMADPTNAGLVDELRIRTQLNIRPFLCGPRQIERSIERYYGGNLSAPDVPIQFEPSAPRAAAAAPAPHPGRHNQLAYDGLRPFPSAPVPTTAPLGDHGRDAEIDALQDRISRLEALVERDEEVLRKLLALLVDKGLATRDEIVARLG